MTLTDQIRQIIIESGVSQYALSKHTDISQSILSAYLNGKQISGSTLDTLADWCGVADLDVEPHATYLAERVAEAKATSKSARTVDADVMPV